jgi:hypothetical protein
MRYDFAGPGAALHEKIEEATMALDGRPFEKAMKLAIVSGMRCALGPALLLAARARPERKNLVLLALGELVADKLPIMPSRSALPLLAPRALAGAWVTKQVLEEETGEPADPWTVALGAAVAVGVGTIAPLIRKTVHGLLDVPDALTGVAEDYLALKLGGEAVGLSFEEMKELASESVGAATHPLADAAHSAGAGSI